MNRIQRRRAGGWLGLALVLALDGLAHGAGGFVVPKQVKKAASARKAELAKLKVGLQPFRHFYKARLDQMGVEAYVPLGEPVTYDFSTSIPPGWGRNSANGVGTEIIEKDKVQTFWMRVPSDRWERFRGAATSYSFQARVKRVLGEQEAIWGIYLDDTDTGFYLLSVKGTGEAKLWRVVGKRWDFLADWTTIPGGLAKDDWNTFKLERQGDKLIGFVNGQQVVAAADSPLPRGIAGVYFADLGKVEIDDVVIQNLEVSKAEVTAGSGYDYTEEVLAGLLDSGLFSAAQVGISNDPVSEPWDFTAGSEQLDARGTAALKYFVGRGGDEKPVLNESLDLPKEWSTKPGRVPTMTRFGEYLAYRVAAQALGVAWEGKP